MHTTKDLFSALFVKFIIVFFSRWIFFSLSACVRHVLLPYFDLAKWHAFKSFGHDTFSVAGGSGTLSIDNSIEITLTEWELLNAFAKCYCVFARKVKSSLITNSKMLTGWCRWSDKNADCVFFFAVPKMLQDALLINSYATKHTKSTYECLACKLSKHDELTL